jgi:hypothetical protein
MSMSKKLLVSMMVAGSLTVAFNAPNASADYIYKSFTCPGNGKVIVPNGSRFEINDIMISTNKDQAVTLKFSPSNRIFIKVFMKARVPFETNLSGDVDSAGEQGLRLDCTGNSGTTVTVTVTGNGNL